MTVLALPVSAQDNTLTTDSPVSVNSALPWRYTLDSEVVYVTGADGTRLSVDRGGDDTTRAVHTKGTTLVAAPIPTSSGGSTPTLNAVIVASVGEDIADALDVSNTPSVSNPFATIADLSAGSFPDISGDTGSATAPPSIAIVGAGSASTVVTQGGGAGTAATATVTAAGGAAPAPVIAFANGVVKNWSPPGFDPTTTQVLLVDPTPQDWQDTTTYSVAETFAADGSSISIPSSVCAFVVPTTNPNGVVFAATTKMAGQFGTVQPTWPTNGDPPPVAGDGDVVYGSTTFAYVGAWVTLTAYADGDTIIESGWAWIASGVITSGVSKPDFAAAIAASAGDVADGSGVWDLMGPAVTWSSGGAISGAISPDHAGRYTPYVLPTAPAGWLFSVDGFTGLFAVSGGTEPVGWDAEMPGSGHYYADGPIQWQETTSNPAVAISGIDAPSGLVVTQVANITVTPSEIVFIDQTNVVANYGSDAESIAANRFDDGGNDITLSEGTYQEFAYLSSTWRSLLAS